MSIEQTEVESAAVQKEGTQRVSLDSIKEKVNRIEFINPKIAPHMTVVLVELKNGYIVIGKSAPADPNNFNQDLGRKFAVEDALRQIWPLEGYLLCEKLAGE